MTLVSFVAALVAGFVVAFFPSGTSCSVGLEAGQRAAVETCRSTTLLAEEGLRILAIVAIPIAVTLVPVLVPSRVVRVVAALLLWIGCALAILSIGIFFVPAAIVMTVAAVMRDRVPSHAV
jgi:hypothetical protein